MNAVKPDYWSRFKAFSALTTFFLFIFMLDIGTPAHMTVRPLYILPVLLSGLIGEWNFVACIAVMAATLRGGSHYYSDPLQTEMDICVNFAVSLISCPMTWHVFELFAPTFWGASNT